MSEMGPLQESCSSLFKHVHDMQIFRGQASCHRWYMMFDLEHGFLAEVTKNIGFLADKVHVLLEDTAPAHARDLASLEQPWWMEINHKCL